MQFAEMLAALASMIAVAAGVVFGSSTGASAAQPTLPTYAQAYEPRTVDERGMWMQADEYERALRDSPLVIRDEALNKYVRDVMCRTVGADRCQSVRIYLLEVPAFNASMAPNGAMTVWSGLLLRTRNEAELGAVLGHEFAHFELRHTLDAFKRRRSATDVMAWATVLGALANTNTTYLQWSVVGSVFQFNRHQEEGADILGLQYLAQSDYPAVAASDVWKHLMAEQDATAVGRKRKPKHRYTAGFFDSHPTELKRATYLADAAKKLNDAGDAQASSHRLALAPYLTRFLSAQIKLNDFGGSEYLINELASGGGWTGDLLFAKGELYRLRGNPRDLASAAQFYSQAITAGYKGADARRNLGLALLRNGQGVEGKTALQEYLRLSPDASDAKAISALIEN